MAGSLMKFAAAAELRHQELARLSDALAPRIEALRSMYEKPTMTPRTYRAIQVSEPKKLELVQRAVTEPSSGKVRVRVEACGVCHSDTLTVEGGFPGVIYPR